MDFPEKYKKKLPENFESNCSSETTEQLKKRILASESVIYTIDKNEKSDVKLNAAKDLVKEYGGAYREAKNVEMAKIKYCLYLIESRGEDLDNAENKE